MKFKHYYEITLRQIGEEIEKDNKIVAGKEPLFESPLYHEAKFFGHMDDIKTNHPFAVKRMGDSKFVEVVNINKEEYKLYRNFEDGYIWDIFISGQDGHELVSAFVRYNIEGGIVQVGGIWQIEFVIGLVRGLFNTYYPKQFSIIESDAVANRKGKNFYQNLAKDYLDRGMKVTVVVRGTETPYKQEEKDSYWERTGVVPSMDKKLRFYTR